MTRTITACHDGLISGSGADALPEIKVTEVKDGNSSAWCALIPVKGFALG